MTDVFISYKREEREKIVLIADRLRALGLDVWFDARLTTGHHFDREIDNHVRIAKCVLVCWSPGALTSDWVRAEAAIGRERNVIVPLLMEACTPPVPFNTLQTESLIGWAGEGDFEGWLRALERIGVLTRRSDLISAERARGANEVETRRIQAMLDAQRREEEEAQRRAEAASAERLRLEAELAARGTPALQPAPRAQGAERAGDSEPEGNVVSAAGIVLSLLVAALAGVLAYNFGYERGRHAGRIEAIVPMGPAETNSPIDAPATPPPEATSATTPPAPH